MILETSAAVVAVAFLKNLIAALYKAVRVAFVSTREELAKQMGKVKLVERDVEVEAHNGVELLKKTVKKTFEVADEEFVTLWERCKVFLHMFVTG